MLFYCSSVAAEEQPFIANLPPTLVLGNHLFGLGNYDSAITEYKRFLFFHAEDARVGYVYSQIGFAYRSQGLWEEAIASMRVAIAHAANEFEKSERQLELAVIQIASENYERGLFELLKIMVQNPPVPIYHRARFLQGVAYLYQFRWEDAREALRAYTNDKKLQALFERAVSAPRKSIKFAKLLSVILPGAGQGYAGNWQEGLNALVLNGVLGFLTVDAMLDGRYIDAILWGTSVFVRYYQGNTYRAGKAAEEFNDKAARLAAENILQRLQEIADKP